MDSSIISRRDSLFQVLEEKFKGTKFIVCPRSEKKYKRNEETTIVIKIPDLAPEKTTVCGVQVQRKSISYKIWFDTHPEWELNTSYPVTEWAQNGSGRGSGRGFYIETETDCIKEIENYLEKYYK